MKKILIIVPTYNEKNNIKPLIKKINLYIKNYSLLFIDDNTPDSTKIEIQNFIKKNKNIYLINRKERLGVGSAHKYGIRWAYKKKFKIIITMDCDGTHNPINIPKMLKKLDNSDLITTNRFLNKNSLSDWSYYRKFLTHLRHFVIKFFLNMPLDSSGAFRCYKSMNIKLNDILLAKTMDILFFGKAYLFYIKKNIKFPKYQLNFQAEFQVLLKCGSVILFMQYII